jgi:hypothetical protein
MFQKNMKNSKFVSMRYCFGKEYKILKIAKFYQSNIALETFMFFTRKTKHHLMGVKNSVL